MKLRVFSKLAIAYATPPKCPYIVISVTNTGDTALAYVPQTENCLGVLRLSFDDITKALPDIRQLKPFTEDDARQVLAFVKRYANAEECWVHCQQGKRRSPAIAAALCKLAGKPDISFFRRYQPNRLVYQTIVETSRKKTYRRGTDFDGRERRTSL